MDGIKYIVRNMVKDDVPKALDVWRETGMNQGENSLYVWLEVDPEAFKIAVTDDGKIIGVCAATIHHEDLVFVGLYCVREKYRGRGIGFKLWGACMEHIAHRNACLIADPQIAELYRSRGGFPILESEYPLIIYRSDSPVNADKLSETPPRGVSVEQFKEMHLPLIYDYDAKLIGYDRKLPIKLSCKQPDSRTLVAVKDGECVGFGTIKTSCQNLLIIGPLYADDKEVAEVLLKKLILSLPQTKGLWMIALSHNQAFNDLLINIGCVERVKCAHLYRKRSIGKVDVNKVYAILDANFSPY